MASGVGVGRLEVLRRNARKSRARMAIEWLEAREAAWQPGSRSYPGRHRAERVHGGAPPLRFRGAGPSVWPTAAPDTARLGLSGPGRTLFRFKVAIPGIYAK